MKSTNTLPRRSHRNMAKDAQAAPSPSSLPSQHCSPSKKEEQGGNAALTPSFPSITLAAVNAANAAAVTAANPHRKFTCPLAPTVDISALVSSTLPASVAAIPAANIMPAVALAPNAKISKPEAVAADVSVTTVAAYSTSGVTITNDAKMGVKTVKALSVTANFATTEAVAADVSVATAAAFSKSAADVDLAATVASAVAVAALAVASVGKEGVSGYILHEFIYCTNSYLK
jgi:hypothetical protein